MILYINGDSNAAGAEAANPCAFARDEWKYRHLGRRPHPENEAVCWGTRLAQMLAWEYHNDAESASSNDRILRTTTEYLKTHRPDAIVIGWTTWEREEWFYENHWWQVNGSGRDTVPMAFKEQYKKWVSEQGEYQWEKKEIEWHEKIWSLHQDLLNLKIPHLFFNCYSTFHNISYKLELEHLRKNWSDRFIGPYTQSETYYDWLINNGQSTVKPGSYHFGKTAHQKWAEFLYPQLTRLL
jgi:hypothetical protein